MENENQKREQNGIIDYLWIYCPECDEEYQVPEIYSDPNNLNCPICLCECEEII